MTLQIYDPSGVLELAQARFHLVAAAARGDRLGSARFQRSDQRILHGKLGGRLCRVASELLAKRPVLLLELREPLQIGAACSTDLMREHVQLFARRGKRLRRGHRMRHYGPQGSRISPRATLFPLSAYLVVALAACEAPHHVRELALELFMHERGKRRALARRAYSDAMQLVIGRRIPFRDLCLPRELAQLGERDAGADHDAVMLDLDLPQLAAAVTASVLRLQGGLSTFRGKSWATVSAKLGFSNGDSGRDVMVSSLLATSLERRHGIFLTLFNKIESRRRSGIGAHQDARAGISSRCAARRRSSVVTPSSPCRSRRRRTGCSR